ncbi:isopeptide-forming domain-containing fimbrial protein [Paenibacillus sp. 5J-6]|uniref:Isopeptide-forming domain-containing fimbrial protein n=1 Tax=Paenibacillus silvestris TaxID=2606219 RepID=A0A6L8V2I1_9BACL|nr:S-layer homology domain-containing protein [Paenibacillus silvestris]MZQ83430.1 isopeptide-forming domain-containing fimbrial protein [Paenibacillus silvestris]
MLRYRKKVAILMSLMLVIQLIGGMLGAVQAAPTNAFDGNKLDEFSVTGYDADPNDLDGQQKKELTEAVLGRDTEILVHAHNKAPGEMAFNVGVEVILPDGLELASDMSPSTVVTDSGTGTITAFWKDIKDIAAGESFDFPVKIKVSNNYRKANSSGLVPFGTFLTPTVRLFASRDARNVYYDAALPTKTWSKAIKVTPFSIRIIDNVKNVKGAGPDATPPAGGSEWGELPYKIEMVNNARSSTSFTLFEEKTDAAIELYGFEGQTGTPTQSVSNGERTANWTLPALTVAGEDGKGKKTFSYQAAFLNTDAGNHIMQHGTQKDDKFDYSAIVDGQPYSGSVTHKITARDIVIYKGVQKKAGSSAGSDVGYNDRLVYTLRVKVNEYVPVTGITVKDTLGDGQDFVDGSVLVRNATNGTISPDLTKTGSGNGTTVLTWTLGDMDYTRAADREYTITYEATVRSTWKVAKSGGSNVVAADVLVNKAEVSGASDSSGAVTDSDSTEVHVTTPSVSEKIVKVNDGTIVGGQPVNELKQAVTVGDTASFRVAYDAVGLQAKQHNVKLYDYLPLGTLLEGPLNSYQINEITPTYEEAMHALVWDFGDTDLVEGQISQLDTEVKVRIQDDTSYVKKDKGAKNLVVLTYENSEGIVESKRKEVELAYVEPDVSITRTVSKTTDLHGNESVLVTIKLTNNGYTPAYHVKLTDKLADGLQNLPVSPDYTQTDTLIKFNEIPSIQPGAANSVTLTYTAKLTDPIGASRDIVLKDATWTYYGQNNTSAGVINRPYSGQEITTTTLTAAGPTIMKTVEDTSGTKTSLKPGDWVVYKVEVKVPTNNVAYSPSVEIEIPSNEAYLATYTGYDSETDTGTGALTVDTSTAGYIKFAGMAEVPGATYTYYVKANVKKINAGTSVSESSGATFRWNAEASGSNKSLSVQNTEKPTVTIKAPQLEINLTPSTTSMKAGDTKAYTVTVKNKGLNPAYNFTPTVTLPAGFSYESGDGTATGLTRTFPEVLVLANNDEQTYTFTARLDNVKGSGSTQSIQASTGDYYSLPAGGAKYDYVAGLATVEVPRVTITNVITATSSGDISKIRPGDTVDYQVEVTIPDGTIAYDVVVEDVVDSLGSNFSITNPGNFTVAGNKLTKVLNNSETDASTGVKVLTYTFQVQAKAGVFASGEVVPYKTTAVAKWHKQSGSDPAQTADAVTSIAIMQPKLTIDPVAIADTKFSKTNTEITVEFELNNVGNATAYKPSVEVKLPSELNVKPGSISDSGSLSGGDTLTWSALSDLAVSGKKKVTFIVTTKPEVVPGTTGITINGKITGYESRETTPVAIYTPVVSLPQVLSVDVLTVSASIKESTNNSTTTVRPGDEVTYLLSVDQPLNTTSYHVNLDSLSGLVQQEIISVGKVDGSSITDIPKVGNKYPLSQITGDASPTVPSAQYQIVTRLKTDGPTGAYFAQFTPKLDYQTADTAGAPRTISAGMLSVNVVQPDISLLLSSVKPARPDGSIPFDTASEELLFTMKLTNNGQSTAFNPFTAIQLPTGVHISWADPRATVSGSTYDLTWESMPIQPGSSSELQFKVQADNATVVSSVYGVRYTLNEYYSLPSKGGKQYEELSSNLINAVVLGQHTLNTAPDQTVKAAQAATFPHIVTNTGAGVDLFKLEVNTPFATDVVVNGQVVATWAFDQGQWKWTFISPDVNQGGVPGFTLNAGQQQALQLVVHVPEGTPYDNDHPHLIGLKASAIGSGNQESIQDKLYVVGDPLDGWAGSQPRSPWTEPVLAPGDPLKLSAVSSNDVQRVEAVYLHGSHSEVIQFVLTNPDTFITDGHKEWKNVLTRLPDDILGNLTSESFKLTFIGYDAAIGGHDIQTDAPAGAFGGNNGFTVKNAIEIIGTITDAGDQRPIAGAIVTLYNEDASHVEIAKTTTDASGGYNFGQRPAARYSIVVQAENYAEASKTFYAIPSTVGSNQVIVDAELSQYRLVLKADPSSIVGDGQSTTILTAVVLDQTGQPLSNVHVNFSAPVGTFVGGSTAITNEKGEAKVTFKSAVIEGIISERFPIQAIADDSPRDLHAKAQIIMTFEPASIVGTVTEMIDGVVTPVNGAHVVITANFDANPDIDFTGEAYTVTKDTYQGYYKIAIPRGGVDYQMQITKPVQIGGHTQLITYTQTITAGAVSGAGHEEFRPTKGASGLIALGNDDQSVGVFPTNMTSKMRVRLLDNSNHEISNAPLQANGTFSMNGLTQGEYKVEISYEVEPGAFIVLNENAQGELSKLKISSDGELNIALELIDPYGKVTDAATGAVIEGAHVELYYADTPRNATGGKIKHTLVPLPILAGFQPNENKNPQNTDAAGDYAYMVFSTSDYYVRVTKPGYVTYVSPTISVEYAIVRHDLQMQPESSDSGNLGGSVVLPGQTDLSVHLFSDKANYGEDQEITFTVEYSNKTGTLAQGVLVTAQIPTYTTVADVAGGSVNGNTITWTIGDLAANGKGSLTYKVKVLSSALPKAEQNVTNEASISSKTTLVHLEDDKSTLQVMLFSNRYEDSKHTRYIMGYPDLEFKPLRNITRAEVAAIFARIMNLRSTVKGEVLYPDVPVVYWGSEYIEAATRAGLFGGYEDRSFRPDKAITRAELSAVIARYLNLKADASNNLHFSDISTHWAKNEIEEIYRYHIINGYPNGSFQPGQAMIRAEAVTMINRLLHRGPLKNASQSFPDVSPSYWGFEQVEESANTHEYKRNEDGSETLTKLIPEPLW